MRWLSLSQRWSVGLIVSLAVGLIQVRGQWVLDSFDPNPNLYVTSIVVESDGKILIGGTFTTLSPNGGATVFRNRMARLNSDGTVEAQFNPNVMPASGLGDSGVGPIAFSPDGKILVGGTFYGSNSIGGQARNYVARVDAGSGLADSFNPQANSNIYSFGIQSDGRVLVGGAFYVIGAQARSWIARLDPNFGLPDLFNPAANGAVLTIAIQADGKILVGGAFTSIGGQPRSYVARLDPVSGAADPSFDPNANGVVSTIVIQADGKILVGGAFTSIGGQPRSYVAKLDPVTGAADPSFDPNANGAIGPIVIQADGKILVGGDFGAIGGQVRRNIARLDPTTGLADSFDAQWFNHRVTAIGVQADGKIIVGGRFTRIGPNGGPYAVRNSIARFSPLTSVRVSARPMRPNSAVITVEGGTAKILIAGLGPSLNVGSVSDPVLQVFDSTNTLKAINNDFGESSGIPAELAPDDARESALVVDLQPGSYTVIQEGNCGKKGNGKIVVYDMTNSETAGEIPTSTGDDTDGDALPDEWETRGLTVSPSKVHPDDSTFDVCYPSDVSAETGGVFLDLKKMGANPKHRDIFVHADWMAEEKPSSSALQRVIDAFAIAPGGGINLHIDLGSENAQNGFLGGEFSQAHQVPFFTHTLSFTGDLGAVECASWGEVDAFKSSVSDDGLNRGFTRSKREKVFHYVLFANAIGCENSRVTGVSRGIPGRDFVVALGAFSQRLYKGVMPMPSEIIEMHQATSFMHELGHNLGLRHGGNDNIQRKPNYLSLMNYAFTGVGILNVDGTRSLDYSRAGPPFVPTLDENNLDESIGIRDPKHLTLWYTEKQPDVDICPSSPPPFTPNDTSYNHLFPSSVALDWNQNGMIDFASLQTPIDLNGDGRFSTLTGAMDWLLNFKGINVTNQCPPIVRKAPTSTDGDADAPDDAEPPIDVVLQVTPQQFFDEEINAPQDVVTVAPQEGMAPLIVKFDGTASTAVDGTIVNWSWEFGDGTSDFGPTVTHTYNAPGDYYARLKIIDSSGRKNLIPLLHHIAVTSPPDSIRQLANISTRARVSGGDSALIGGFIITGTEFKKVALRAIGPSLSSAGVPGALSDPALDLYDSNGAVIAMNDNWRSSQQLDVEDSHLLPSVDSESAIVISLAPGAYTTIVRGAGDSTGVGLVEVYDLDPAANSKLGNISSRGHVEIGDNVMIGGFIVTGNVSQKVLVRAIGPSLPVTGKLADPTLELYDGNGTSIRSNDNWRSNQEGEIVASTIPPSNEAEAAIVATLPPGGYTAIVRGANQTTGVALVEVYALH